MTGSVRRLLVLAGLVVMGPAVPADVVPAVGGTALCAQVPPDSARRAPARADSARADSARQDADGGGARLRTPIALPPGQDTSRGLSRQPAVLRPPLSPRRAFLLSALLPGYAQSRLERGTSGALFAGVEMAVLAMLRRSVADVREVRRQRTDTLPGDFTVGPDGTVRGIGGVPPRFESTMEASRQLHVEDWTAALVFNHLIAGADAFVAAQLWDVPTRVSVVPTRDGLALVASLRF